MVVLETAALTGVVQGLMKSLTTLVLHEYLKGLGKDTTPGRMYSLLLDISALLIDAEEKQIEEEAVKDWVREVKDAVYVAEDALDDLATEASRRRETPIGTWIDNLPSLLKSKLVKVEKTFQSLYKRNKNLGLKVKTRMSDKERSDTTSAIGEQEVLGRQIEKKKIMGFLTENIEENNRMSVVAIVGTGGIGKTALAQLLYNDVVFETQIKKAWIHVKEHDKGESLTQRVYDSLVTPHRFANSDQLQSGLKEWLRENKILLVLDDMWLETFEGWDLLWGSFASASKGSRIIVTTRSQEVATRMHASPEHTHTLQPLQPEDCWSLFKKHALPGAQEQDPDPIFKKFKEEVELKCKGLPLAAKAFGGVLGNKKEGDYWKRVLKNKIWMDPIHNKILPVHNKILPVLLVSYHYLPHQLKRCFAYCSIFPKGYAFDKKRVILLWMAEGLLHKERGSTERMEEVGDRYFKYLVDRSLFQQDIIATSKFTMHDLINELAQFAAGEFCFKYEDQVQGIKYEDQVQGITGKTRHLSYLRDQYSGEAIKFEELSGANFLRTFLPLSLHSSAQTCCLHKMVTDNLLPRLTCLRVLSLSHYDISKLPSNIFKKMKHVRYLNLSGTNLSSLPKSVKYLYNLQTLLLSCCLSLMQLDEGICDLTGLEYLDLSTTDRLKHMPKNFATLQGLQTLTNFVVGAGNEAAKISALKDFTELRGKLTILELHKVGHIREAEEANLESKTLLKEIEFTWRTPSTVTSSPVCNEVDIFEKLRPHNEIEELTIRKYYANRFPAWMSDPSFSRIVRIRLIGCKYYESLPSLGSLPHLEELHISTNSHLRHIGSEFFYIPSEDISPAESRDQDQKPFNSLRILSFTNMQDWKAWVHAPAYGETLFPCLQKVTIQNCPKLATDLPGRFPSLTSLQIFQCKSLVFQLDAHKYPQLKQLTIQRSCDSLATFPLGCCSTLERLEISDCSLRSFELLAEHPPGFSALRELKISDCPKLTVLPKSVRQSQTLKLDISGCSKLPVLLSIPTSASATKNTAVIESNNRVKWRWWSFLLTLGKEARDNI